MNDQLKKLEETLQIKFEVLDYGKEQDNFYHCPRNSQDVWELQLKDVTIDDINILLPFAKNLYRLNLINCTIGNFSSLIHLPNITRLILDNVRLSDIAETGQENNPIIYGHPAHVYLENMSILHLTAFLPLAKGINHLFITNCTIHNFYEVNLLSNLYDLRLDGVTIVQSETDIIHQAKPDRYFYRIWLTNMHLKDLAVFIPISEKVGNICIETSTIDSIRGLHVFEKLEEFSLDGDTVINDREPSKDQPGSFELSMFVFDNPRSDEEEPDEIFDLHNLGSIAHCIKTMSFKGRYAIANADLFPHFSQLEELVFEKNTVKMGDFLPVAHQIKKIEFDETTVTQSEAFEHFRQLEFLKSDGYQVGQGVQNFKHLLPLKHSLKKLQLEEDEIKNLEFIEEFTALESLSVTASSIKATQSVLSLSSLRRLRLFAHIDPVPANPPTFNIERLKNLTALSLICDDLIPFEGIEFLTELEWLHMDFTCQADRLGQLDKLKYLDMEAGKNINQVPAIHSLQVLDLEVEKEDEIHSLERFLNLEKLKISACKKINIGRLEKLKVFCAQWIDLETTLCFEGLPNLEELDLSDSENTMVKNLDQLTKLQILDLSENQNIENIDGLENLKSLEYLNLYENKISDISVLNKLPNLKLANLDGNYIAEKDIHKLLDKPEVACFLSIPYIPFSIWKREYFEL